MLFLPYFHTTKNQIYYSLANFLRRKFFPKLRKILPTHYLFNQDPRYYLKSIRKKSKTHSYFLRFDIEKYYPSINLKILLEKIPEIYQNLTHKNLSRRFKKHLETTLPEFLSQSPYPNHGLSIGSPLSYILAGIFLLELDLKLKEQTIPFLRFNDDYLVFAKSGNKAQKIFKELIIPTLSGHKLSVNPAKVSSGKFHQDRVCFLGFCYFAGYFGIEEKRIKKFKRKITKITYPKKNKPIKAIVKLLNNQILGFGHYYKLASAKQEFRKLDAFVRKRLRIYLVQTSQKPTLGNLYLKNAELYNLGLKSLVGIYEKYQEKIKKLKPKTGKKARTEVHHYRPGFLYTIEEKRLFEMLEEITRMLSRVEEKLDKIEKKVGR